MFLLVWEVSKDSGSHERLLCNWCQSNNQLASEKKSSPKALISVPLGFTKTLKWSAYISEATCGYGKLKNSMTPCILKWWS